MKKTKIAPVQMLKASEAIQISAENKNVGTILEAQKRAAKGAAELRESLRQIKHEASLGNTCARVSGSRIVVNALRGMGYRVYENSRWMDDVTAHWDERPSGLLRGFLWDLVNALRTNA